MKKKNKIPSDGQSHKDIRRVGIIGFGRFGALAGSILSEHFEVCVYDPRSTGETIKRAKQAGVQLADRETAAQCDMVILCAPINETEQAIRHIAKHVKPGAIIMDACSVKVLPCKWLKKHLPKTVYIIGTHPMFGPVTSRFDIEKQAWHIEGLQIVLCPIRIPEARLAKIRRFLSNLGLKTIITSPEEHDRQNAYSLALVHFIGRSLYASGAREQKIYTPGYSDLLRLYKHTVNDSWELFYDMHNYNPYSAQIRGMFITSCQAIDRKVKNNKNRK